MVCEFLDELLTKGKNRVNSILTKMNNKEISQKDYCVGIVDMSNYFVMLADKTIFILTPNDNVVENISKISANLSDNTKMFESYISFIENMTDSWEEFRIIDTNTKAELATALMGMKINPEELGCAGMDTEEIVEKMCSDKKVFSQVQNVVSKEFKEKLKTKGHREYNSGQSSLYDCLQRRVCRKIQNKLENSIRRQSGVLFP